MRYCLKELVENKRLREQRLYVLGNNGVHRIRVSCAPGLPVLACGCSSLAQLHQQGSTYYLSDELRQLIADLP